MFFLEQMFLIKTGNEHTCESTIKTKGIIDLTLFTVKINFEIEVQNFIVEEDSTVLENT